MSSSVEAAELRTTANSIPGGWAERNEHWIGQARKRQLRRAVRERRREPLILCGHGVSLRIDRGTLRVRNGLTHYPQEREEYRFFPGDLNLPQRVIMLDGTGSLSFDVLAWLSEQRVTLTRIGWQGEVVNVIGGTGAAFDSERVLWQIATREDPAKRLAFCCELIARKLAGSLETLRTAIPDSSARVRAVDKALAAIALLQSGAPRTVDEVRLIEARAAAAYFTAWRALPLHWRSKARFPIPEGWLYATSRRSRSAGDSVTNRHATHPLNAMLNYAYAILHSRIHIEAVADGYDPSLGIMHQSRPDAQAFILDLMEVHRPAVDGAVLLFAGSRTFSGADFVVRRDGVCRLSSQLGRALCQTVLRGTSVSEMGFAPSTLSAAMSLQAGG